VKALFLLALGACALDTTSPVDHVGPGGKGDDPTEETAPVATRRTLAGVTCPEEVSPFKVAFFDADSTIRVSKSGAVTADSATDVNVLPFAAREIERLVGEGYLVAVVSNQGGVGSGHQTFETAEQALALAIAKLDTLGAHIHYFDFAEEYNGFRKPKTGMADLLDETLVEACGAGIDFAQSFMVGDSGYKRDVDGPHPDGRPADDFSNSDRLFAENLEIPFHEPTDFFGWRSYDVFNIASQDELDAFLGTLEASNDPILQAEAAANRAVNELPLP
jgi:DNA 3'-phosphatase